MAGRAQVEERRVFDINEKLEVLLKSHSRCAHCGRPVHIGSNFSIEHVIPLSKGGTNELSNLVALCKECNKEKSDLVVDPKVYYPYLDSRILSDLQQAQIAFYDSQNWLSNQDFSKADIYRVRAPRFYLQGDKGTMQLSPLLHGTTIEKMYYNAMDDVYHFKLRYYNKHGKKSSYYKSVLSRGNLESKPDVLRALKASIEVDFGINACYIVRRPNKTILGTFSIKFRDILLRWNDERAFIISIAKICISRYDMNTIIQLAHAIDVVVHNIGALLGLEVLVVEFDAADLDLCSFVVELLHDVAFKLRGLPDETTCVGFSVVPHMDSDTVWQKTQETSDIIAATIGMTPYELRAEVERGLERILPDIQANYREIFTICDIASLTPSPVWQCRQRMRDGADEGSAKKDAEAICKAYMSKLKSGST